MNLVYISDTNIWIDFRNAGLLDVLFSLPFTLCCTDFVLSELDDFDHAALRAKGLQVDELDENAISQLFDLTSQHNNSSLADVSCYHLAKSTGRPLLTGDGQLRKQAAKDGLKVHGALWLLDRLVETALVPPNRAAVGLTTMLSAGARLPKAECEARLAAWNKV
ncbi:MAG: type II toxin-antitoxin system VapC family toxin [Pseudomonadota bacterium]